MTNEVNYIVVYMEECIIVIDVSAQHATSVYNKKSCPVSSLCAFT